MDPWIISSFLSTMNKTAMNICLHVFGEMFSFLWVDVFLPFYILISIVWRFTSLLTLEMVFSLHSDGHGYAVVVIPIASWYAAKQLNNNGQ